MVESSVAKDAWLGRRGFFSGPAPASPAPIVGPTRSGSKLAPATNLPG
jgi:hypothetical protein